MVEPDKRQMTTYVTRSTRFSCGIPKARNTHSKHAILIAFLQQQWLGKGALLLRYTTSPVIFDEPSTHIYCRDMSNAMHEVLQ